MEESSSSGPIEMPTGRVRSEFSHFTLLFHNSHSVLYQAQRYGKNFILKFMTTDYPYEMVEHTFLGKEFSLAVQLDHPNIVRVYSLERVPGRGNCIVMEYVDGVPLDEWLSTDPSLEERKRVFLQLLDAISYIHSHQIIHRDLKPSNVLITRNGNNVKLIDFGFSDSDSYAILKQSAGTYKYMSPEQKEGGRTIDARSDIYSLGLLMQSIFRDKYANVAARCLKESPEDRYANVHQLRADFLAPSKWPWVAGGLVFSFVVLVVFLFMRRENVADVENVPVPDQEVRKENVRQEELPESKDSIVGEVVDTQKSREEQDARMLAQVKTEAKKKCQKMKQAYERAVQESEYQEHLTQRIAYLSNVNVLDFYRRTVRSNWTKEEYAAYSIVFQENNNYYKEASEAVKGLPTYTSLYYHGKDNSPVYDSLEYIREKISKETTDLFDSINAYNGQFYQWSVQHLQ